MITLLISSWAISVTSYDAKTNRKAHYSRCLVWE